MEVHSSHLSCYDHQMTPQTFSQLKDFLRSKTGLRMSHIYKPVMLLSVIRNGGAATKREIAESFVLSDSDQIDYYRKKIVHSMPGNRLVRDSLLSKDGETYRLPQSRNLEFLTYGMGTCLLNLQINDVDSSVGVVVVVCLASWCCN